MERLLDKSVYSHIHSISSSVDRNILRGIIAEDDDRAALAFAAEVRRRLSPPSLRIVVPKFFGSGAALDITRSQASFIEVCTRKSIHNPTIDQTVEFIGAIAKNEKPKILGILAGLASVNASMWGEPDKFVSTITKFLERYGPSRCILKKFAAFFSMRGYELGKRDFEQLISAFEEYSLSEVAHLYADACEALNPRLHPFEMYKDYFGRTKAHKFRTGIELGFIGEMYDPLPRQPGSVSRFLDISLQTSFVDLVSNSAALVHLSGFVSWSELKRLRSSLGEDFNTAVERGLGTIPKYQELERIIKMEEPDLAFYSLAPAIMELRCSVEARHAIDSQVLPRLYYVQPESIDLRNSNPVKRDISKHFRAIDVQKDEISFKAGSNGRLNYTVAMLPTLTSVSKQDTIEGQQILSVFDNCLDLTVFLNEDEIRRKVAMSQSSELGNLPALMWSAVLLEKLHDVDSEFEFNSCIEEFCAIHGYNQVYEFFVSVFDGFENAATYVNGLLTVRRLSKCYGLIESYHDALETKESILRYCAKVAGEADLLLAADQISFERKTGGLKGLIDESRIYIEERPFRNWVKNNVVGRLSEFARHGRSLKQHVATEDIVHDKDGRIEINPLIKKYIANLQATFLTSAVESGFSAFCCDRYFGIDSFLSRRIRHNTLNNFMTHELREILENSISRISPENRDEIRALFEEWLQSYRNAIDEARSERLVFRSEVHPDGILKSNVDRSDPTFVDICQKLGGMALLRKADDELFVVLIEGCWRLLGPMLQDVRKYIRKEFRQNLLSTVYAFSSRIESFDIHRKLTRSLEQEIAARVEHVVTWFHPNNPLDFSSTYSAITEMVWSEFPDSSRSRLLVSGDGKEDEIYGPYVHFVFDCLTVLMQNAFSHSTDNQQDTVDVRFERFRGDHAAGMKVVVTSRLVDCDDGRAKFREVQNAMASKCELDAAMVSEGYTGIRKLMFLLKRLRLFDSFFCEWSDDKLRFSFKIDSGLGRHEEAS